MSRPYSVGTILTTTTKTTIYTVPTGYYAKWNLCYVVNHAGNNKTIDVSWTNAAGTKEVFVLDKFVLASKAFVKFDGGAFVILEEGDVIKAQAETGSQMHLINTFELVRK